MKDSKIEWTDNTFNAWHGCTNVSPACDNCYAETLASRHLHTSDDLWGKDAARMITSEENWSNPYKWNRIAIKKGILAAGLLYVHGRCT